MGVFGPLLKTVLIAVVPVAVVTTLPVEAVRGAWTWGTVATAAAVAVGFSVGSRLVWRRSLAAYTSASS